MKTLKPLLTFYKSEFNPAKYKWKIDKHKDKQTEMVNVTVYNRKTECKVLYIAASKAIGSNDYCLNINFFADHV